MNFFSMALNNIRKKSDTYFTYFLSTTFAVTIFYIFCSIYFNPEFADFHTGVSKIGIVFQISSIIVLAFSAVFVFYANSLFIKSRKKEIAIFSLLGMRKKEIGKLLFLETLIVGTASIICGIIFGTVFSRFFSKILKKLMLAGAPGNSISFVFTWQPSLISILVFLMLFVLNGIYSFKAIYKSRLIELLNAEKESDTAPKFSVKASVLSIAMILISYGIFLSFDGNDGALKLIKPTLFASIMLAAGTFLLFQNAVIWLFSKCKKNTNLYYKTGNFISMSQIVYRVKANSNIFSVIALLSAFTVSLMSAIISFYISLGNSMPIYSPYSYLCEDIDNSQREKVIDIAKDDSASHLTAVTDLDVITTTASLEGYKVDTNSAYGKVVSDVGDEFTIDIIKFSDYQNVIKDTGAKKTKGNKGAIFVSDLSRQQCLFLDGNYTFDYSKNIIGKEVNVKTDQGNTEVKVLDSSLSKYIGAAHGRTTLVLNDLDYDDYFREKSAYKIKHYTGIKFEKPLYAGDSYDKMNTIVSKEHHDKSYLQYHQVLFAQYGAYIFAGIFLGVLFLMAAGSIIFYKQLMEARDDKGRYEILKKIGMSEKEVLHSVKRQIGIIFLLPFIAAMIHSAVILAVYQKMVYTITVDSPIIVYMLLVVLVYFIIYYLFYLMTVRGYMKTVWKVR